MPLPGLQEQEHLEMKGHPCFVLEDCMKCITVCLELISVMNLIHGQPGGPFAILAWHRTLSCQAMSLKHSCSGDQFK